MIVLDASAAIEVVLQTETGAELAPRLLASSESLHAPHLLDVEVAQVVRRLTLTKHLPQKRAASAVLDLAALPVERYPHDLLIPRAWELRENLTIYDAVYVVLAELLDAPLLTRDERLLRAPGHGARVELI